MCGLCRPTVLGSVTAFRFRLQQHILIISVRLRRPKFCRHAQICMSAFAQLPCFTNNATLVTSKIKEEKEEKKKKEKMKETDWTPRGNSNGQF